MKKYLVLLLALFSMTIAAQETKKNISLEDIFKNRKFSSRGGMSVQSSAGGDHFYQYKKDSINSYEYSTGKLAEVVITAPNMIPAGAKDPIDISSFEFSGDEKRMLFSTDVEPIYRYSTISAFYIYDREANNLVPLSPNGKQRLATFSPDGSKVAFVRENNLFVVSLDEKGNILNEKQLTTDGKMNEIINGGTDWVYEEEFGFTSAFFWSPDSRKLAFYRFDESGVKEFQLTTYGDLYPEQFKYKYPKAGESNSVITLFIADIPDGKITKVNTGNETDIYIPRVKWTNDPSVLSYYRMNRHQNKLELMFADATTGESRPVYLEEDKCYIEINDNLNFLTADKGFVLTSGKDGFNHIYYYDINGKLIRQLTSGDWEVTDIKGVDEKNNTIYFMSTISGPLKRDLCSINLKGGKVNIITNGKGTNTADFNSTLSMFINRFSDINTPPVVTVKKADGTEIRLIQDNSALRKTLSEYNTARGEFFTFITEDGTSLNGWMLKPADFNAAKKYPVLFCNYGGPGSQTVLDTWGMISMWHQLLSQNGIIVVSVDNRGTGGRGEAFKKMTYLQLGKYETIDQIEAAKYLGTLPYIDKDKIGVWGWSYGGYMTLSCMTKGSDYFSTGIAVAPVTNWKYYDNIYTERFMRTPAENPEGYESNSPVNHAEKLKGKLLLIHGTADDNVHAQNSIDMVTALVAADKQFEMQFYPNSNHGIYTGKNTTMHLYKRMTDFLLKELVNKTQRIDL